MMTGERIRRLTALVVTLLAAAVLTAAPAGASNGYAPGFGPEPPARPVSAAAAGPQICMVGHVQDLGWQSEWTCDGNGVLAFAGSVGEGKNLEAFLLYARDTGGQTCVNVHVQNVGWLRQDVCLNDLNEQWMFGTEGQNRPIEAVKLKSSTRTVCLEAHVRGEGWIGNGCAGPGQWRQVGTTGFALPMEALRGQLL